MREKLPGRGHELIQALLLEELVIGLAQVLAAGLQQDLPHEPLGEDLIGGAAFQHGPDDAERVHDLRPAQDEQAGPLRALVDLPQGPQFRLEEPPARGREHDREAAQRRLGAVHAGECIVDERVAQRPQLAHHGRLRLLLEAERDGLLEDDRLFGMLADVVEQQDIAGLEVTDAPARGRPGDIVNEVHLAADVLGQQPRVLAQGGEVLEVHRIALVREHHDLRPLAGQLGDRGRGARDPRVVGDLLRLGVQRRVDVHPHQHGLALDLQVVERLDLPDRQGPSPQPDYSRRSACAVCRCRHRRRSCCFCRRCRTEGPNGEGVFPREREDAGAPSGPSRFADDLRSDPTSGLPGPGLPPLLHPQVLVGPVEGVLPVILHLEHTPDGVNVLRDDDGLLGDHIDRVDPVAVVIQVD